MEKVTGQECPFDVPRVQLPANLIEIGRLSASTLYLERNQTYRGYCIAVYDKRHVTRIDELTPQEWLELAGDLHRAQSAVWKVCSPAHINIASLGNVVPHLHWHLIPRYVDDPRWGNPIWLSNVSEMAQLTLSPQGYEHLIQQFRTALF
jgi:diadenosine tetraphosphate (Ap4A) HIT family hydrolase